MTFLFDNSSPDGSEVLTDCGLDLHLPVDAGVAHCYVHGVFWEMSAHSLSWLFPSFAVQEFCIF
jgi:hypothetical protein